MRGLASIVLDSGQARPWISCQCQGNEGRTIHDQKRFICPHQGNCWEGVLCNTAGGSPKNSQKPHNCLESPGRAACDSCNGFSCAFPPPLLEESEAAWNTGKRSQSTGWGNREANHCLGPKGSLRQPEARGKGLQLSASGHVIMTLH